MSNESDFNTPLSFEDFKNENGIIFWWASDIMKMLGYSNMNSFEKVIQRTTKAFVSLNIPHYENIMQQMRDIDGELNHDFKLTRFACYLLVMNADAKKQEVAFAQAYFATQTRKFELYIAGTNELDRIHYRDEITEGNKSLASTAKNAGVNDFAKFQNAGYIGMYNMASWQLAKKRGVDKAKIMDTMSRTELAANLFRITQTEEKIKNNNISGQAKLEQAHKSVGTEVRNIIIKNMGKTPESLEQEKKLPEIKKDIKKGYKNMNIENKSKNK